MSNHRHNADIALLIVAAGLGVAGVAGASNVVFQAHLTLVAGAPGSTAYWVSLPYSYHPPDANGNLELDAEDLVQDLQPAGLTRPCTEAADDCAVEKVLRWEPATGEYESWTGGSSSGAPFVVQPGSSYGLQIQAVGGQTTHVLDLVGADDHAFSHSECWHDGAVNMRWVSLPPDLSVDTSRGIPGVLDAEDLGHAMGGPGRVVQLRRFDEATGLYQAWVVGSVYGVPFTVDLAEGFAVDLTCPNPTGDCSECTWEWAPPTY